MSGAERLLRQPLGLNRNPTQASALRRKRKAPRQMGIWKGIINVRPVLADAAVSIVGNKVADVGAQENKLLNILQPKQYVVRVYIMQGNRSIGASHDGGLATVIESR